MGTPPWLYYLFGAVMLAVAAYSVGLLVFSVTGRHHSGRDVDIAHIFMGISMAGMFVARWAFGPTGIWEVIFAALVAWFAVRSIRSIRRFGLHKPHEAIHATMSLAMLLMYRYPLGSMAGVTGMAMSSSGSRLDPGIGFVLTVTFLASAIFTLASPVKGASHHGTHAFAYATAAADGDRGSEHSLSHGASVLETAVTTPWLEDLSHVAMCIAMGFMLILMF
jgi:hypothetical protein